MPERQKDTNVSPFLIVVGFLWWLTLACGLLNGFVEPSLDCTAIWDSSSFLPLALTQGQTLSAFLRFLPIFSQQVFPLLKNPCIV